MRIGACALAAALTLAVVPGPSQQLSPEAAEEVAKLYQREAEDKYQRGDHKEAWIAIEKLLEFLAKHDMDVPTEVLDLLERVQIGDLAEQERAEQEQATRERAEHYQREAEDNYRREGYTEAQIAVEKLLEFLTKHGMDVPTEVLVLQANVETALQATRERAEHYRREAEDKYRREDYTEAQIAVEKLLEFLAKHGMDVPTEVLVLQANVKTALQAARAKRERAEQAEQRRREAQEREVREIRLRLEDERAVVIELVEIRAGEFAMGSDFGASNEAPVTQVQIGHDFQLGKYEVTQGQWAAVMGSNPSHFQDCGLDCPVENVSWTETQEFIKRLNEIAGEEGERYRLPTEAEWEYAARAGSAGEFSTPDLGAIAWYDGNSGGRTHPVGQKAPNRFGLHGMLGNVREWVQDWHGEYPGGTAIDPQGPDSGQDRVQRGGTWMTLANDCRVTFRLHNRPDYRSGSQGLRLAKSAPRVPRSTKLTRSTTLKGPEGRPKPKRAPRNDMEDVTKIGDRGVGGKLNDYSIEEEQRLGKRYAQLVENRVSILKDAVINEYINRIVQNLALNSDAKMPISARVINSNQVNAMALPGGYIFVNRGLIEFAADESELAGVLAHEVAHVAARHGTRTMTRARLAGVITETLTRTAGQQAQVVHLGTSLALPLTFLKFSRSFEERADFLGVQYLHVTGYDPLGMVQFFERLSAADRSRGNVISNLFDSHLPSSKRVKRVQKTIDELLPDMPSYKATSSEFDQIKERLRAYR